MVLDPPTLEEKINADNGTEISPFSAAGELRYPNGSSNKHACHTILGRCARAYRSQERVNCLDLLLQVFGQSDLEKARATSNNS